MEKAFLSDSGISINVLWGEGEVDSLTEEEFIARYGEEDLPDMRVELSIELCVEYWRAAYGLVKAWSEYQAKNKLLDVAASEEVSYLVKSVIDKYYRGDIHRLERHVQTLYRKFDKKLTVYIEYCHKDKIDFSELYLKSCTEQKEYSALRTECEKRMKSQAKPLPLYL